MEVCALLFFENFLSKPDFLLSFCDLNLFINKERLFVIITEFLFSDAFKWKFMLSCLRKSNLLLHLELINTYAKFFLVSQNLIS